MFKEAGKEGKLSSKRVWGTILLSSATLMTIFGGLGWYDPNADMVNTGLFPKAIEF